MLRFFRTQEAAGKHAREAQWTWQQWCDHVPAARCQLPHTWHSGYGQRISAQDLSYMVENAFQFFLTRADQEALLARVREHLHPEGRFLFETRQPSPRTLFYAGRPVRQQFATPDGGQLTITDKQPQYDFITQIQHCTSTYQWRYPGGQLEKKTKRTALRM